MNLLSKIGLTVKDALNIGAPGMGLRQSKLDTRDFLYTASTPKSKFTGEIDMRYGMPPIWDQGAMGTCGPHSICAAFEYLHRFRADLGFSPSRMFNYFGGRELEGTTATDSGIELRDGLKAMSKQGICQESLWHTNYFNLDKKPRQLCYDNALKHAGLEYRQVAPNIDDILSALSEGLPIMFGITLFSSFNTETVWNYGTVPMPQDYEMNDSENRYWLGNHGMVACGANLSKGLGLGRNSWGTKFGMKGYFTFPLEFLTFPFCWERWVINKPA